MIRIFSLTCYHDHTHPNEIEQIVTSKKSCEKAERLSIRYWMFIPGKIYVKNVKENVPGKIGECILGVKMQELPKPHPMLTSLS